MKVLFNAIKSNIHSVYQELINYPPDNTSYLFNSERGLSMDKLMASGAYFCGLPNMSLFPKNVDVDLIHSPQQMVRTQKSWVICFEHASALAYNQKNLRSLSNKKIIGKFLASKQCKKIMPWCNAAKNSLKNAVDNNKFSEKIEVVYPAMHKMEITREKRDSVNLLFVGRCFYRKGGIETLKAFEILNRKFNIKLSIVSHVPPEIIEQYKTYPNIEFLTNLSRKELIEKYSANFDIFVLPTSYDTFGMAFLEAMAFELPIITLEGFATSEIVENGKNGYLIKPYSKLWFGDDYLHHPVWGDWRALRPLLSKDEEERIVMDLVNKITDLIENESLRRRMSKCSRKMIENGKFSIRERNNKLERIYREAIE